MQGAYETSIWYIGRDGQQIGPFSTSDLQAQLRSGALLPTDFLWCAELGAWVEASRIFGPAMPPPPPPHAGQVRGARAHNSEARGPGGGSGSPAAATGGASRHAYENSRTVETTVIEGGSFKVGTFIFIVLALLLPLWPVTLPLFLYLAYRSYKKPSEQTVRIVRNKS